MKKLKEKNKNFVRICPKCGSTSVQTDFSNPVVWAYGTTTKFRCNSCSYVGNLFPEISKDNLKDYKEELEEEIKKGQIKISDRETIDSSTGYSVGLFEIMIIVIGLVFTVIYSLLKDRSSIITLILWIILIVYVIWILILKIGEKSDS